jgi:hypothetical protein
MLPSFYHSILEKYLSPTQLLTLQMLVWLLQTQKEVRIERLAATLQLPILQSSRRRHIPSVQGRNPHSADRTQRAETFHELRAIKNFLT